MNEESDVIHACNVELRRKSFDDYLTEEKYRTAVEMTNIGRNPICYNCICCDMVKGGCTLPLRNRVISGYCWKAKNIHLLRKEGLYGQKRAVKSCVD